MLGKAFETISTLVNLTSALSKKASYVALGGVVDKLSDTKLKGASCDVLTALCEAVGPQFVCAQLHKKASAHKSPKVCAHTARTCIGCMLREGAWGQGVPCVVKKLCLALSMCVAPGACVHLI